MQWYETIACARTVKNPLVAGTGDLGRVEEGDLRCGRLIESWGASAWVKASELGDDGDPDDVLQTYLDLPIFSSRLIAAVSEVAIYGLQYLPISVIRPDGILVPGFSLVNILNLASLDLQKSTYDRFPSDFPIEQKRGLVWGVRRPVLVRTSLADSHIVRVREYHYSVFVSDVFKRVFDQNRFTGYDFEAVETS